MLIVAALLASSTAFAESPAATPAATSRDYLMEVNVRTRWLSIPDSILDIWFYNELDQDGLHPERPRVRALGTGLEYVIRQGPATGLFYVDYLHGKMDEGYWDDVEQPSAHDDGDWIEPDGIGVLVLGSNYGHEIYATNWLSFLFGGGIGIGVVTGDLTNWAPGSSSDKDEACLTESPAYYRKDYCAPDGAKRIPAVVPMVDISASSRVHFGDQANLRVDIGLHNMLYVGAAFGAVF